MEDGDHSTDQVDVKRKKHKPKPRIHAEPNIRLSDFNPYLIAMDENLKGGRYIRLNTPIYKKLFANPADIDYIEKPVELRIRYQRKSLFSGIVTRKRVIHVLAAAQAWTNDNKFPEGRVGDDFISTIRVSQDLFRVLKPLTNQSGLINVGLEATKRNFWLGAGFRHPSQEINLGWAFFYISAALSLIMFFVDQMADAYSFSELIRAKLDNIFSYIRHF